MSLLNELFPAEADEDEVVGLIQRHFGFAAERESGVVEYGRQGAAPALMLRYSADERLIEVEPGTGLNPSEVTELRRQIETSLVNHEGEGNSTRAALLLGTGRGRSYLRGSADTAGARAMSSTWRSYGRAPICN